MAKRARTILERCVEDIATTHWCQGSLIEPEYEKKTVVKEWGTYSEPVGAPKKMMGCALGLLAIHGEHGRERTEKAPDGTRFTYFDPAYPHLGRTRKASPGLIRAVTAVYDAMPESRKPKTGKRPPSLGVMDDAIVDYNDAPGTTKGKALNWFRRALESL